MLSLILNDKNYFSELLRQVSLNYSKIGQLNQHYLDEFAHMTTIGKVIILGLTKEGGKFRPSDWAERLCGAVASYGPGRRIIFHPNVKLASHQGVKCVVIDASLEEDDEMLFEFLTDFADENNLQILRSAVFPIEE